MTLRIHHLAAELIDALGPMARQVQRHDADLARQLRRAAQSVLLNVCEGEKLGDNGNQRVHFERAAGSNGEVRAALRIATSWGYLDPAALQRCEALADPLAAMLWRIVHR